MENNAIKDEPGKQFRQEADVRQSELEEPNRELPRAQARWTAADAHYFVLFEHAPVGYLVVDRAGQIVEANLTVATLLAVDRDALLQRSLLVHIVEADRGIYQRYFEHLVAGPNARDTPSGSDGRSCQLRMRKKDGQVFRAQLTASLTPHGAELRRYQLVVTDVTDATRAESFFTESEAWHRLLINAAPDLLFVCDRNGVYLECHASDPRMLLAPVEDFLGRSVRDFHTPEMADRLLATFDRVLSTGQMQELVYSLDLSAGKRWFETRFMAVDDWRVLSIVRDVTEYVLARDSSARYQSQLDQAQRIARLGSWEYDVAENRLLWSDETYRIFGLKREDFRESYEAFLATVHPEDRPAVEEAYARSLRDPSFTYEREHRIIRQDTGEIRHVHQRCVHHWDVAGNPIRSFGAVQDVTERRQMEDALRRHRVLLEQRVAERTVQLQREIQERKKTLDALEKSETYNRALLAAIPDPIFVLDRHGHFCDFHAGTEVDPLTSPEDFLNRHFSDVLPPPVAEKVQLALDCLFAEHRSQKIEYELEMGGSTFFFEAGMISLFENRALIIVRDLTPRKKMEDALRYSLEQAEQANRAKSSFLAKMSHEFRTPLNAIIGFAHLLQDDPTIDDSHAEELRTISTGGEHLLAIIGDILDYARIEAGHLTITASNFCLDDLLDDLESMFRFTAASKALELVWERSAEVPRYVHADQTRLRQILTNLLENAIKFTSTGTVSLRIGLDHTRKPAKHDGTMQHLLVQVADTGPGIPADTLPQIFDGFYQGEPQSNRGGTGLGLSICHSLAQLIGGQITVESEVGKGTCFRVYLPVQPVLGMHALRPSRTRRVVGLEPGTGPVRILVADDQFSNRRLVRSLLEPVGFQVQEARNGQETLKSITQWNPHAVLINVRMPLRDSQHALQTIQGREGDPAPAVIAVSTSPPKPEDEARLHELVVDAHLATPYEPESLFRLLQHILKLRYTYAEQTPKRKLPEKLPPLRRENLDSLSTQQVRNLLQLVEEGDITQLRKQINQLKPQNVQLARQLTDLADRYDYETLSTLFTRS